MGVGDPSKYYVHATNRAGGYAFNWYLLHASWLAHAPGSTGSPLLRQRDFNPEGQFDQPVLTPAVADATQFLASPVATDFPPVKNMGPSGGAPAATPVIALP